MTDNNNIKPTKPVDYCMHVAALRWAQTAFYDGLDAEAEQTPSKTGPIHSSTISLMITSFGGSIMLFLMATLISSRTKSMRS